MGIINEIYIRIIRVKPYRNSLNNLEKRNRRWQQEQDNHAFSLTAITGAGKTVMAAATLNPCFMEMMNMIFDPDPSAVVIWFSDDPSLNEQTVSELWRLRIRLILILDLVVVKTPSINQSLRLGKFILNTQKLNKKVC